jgi:hypothetical protein
VPLDAGERILAFYPAIVESEHDSFLLPVGNWKIIKKKRYPKVKYNPELFWDADGKRARGEDIAAGPRNRVGVVWLHRNPR